MQQALDTDDKADHLNAEIYHDVQGHKEINSQAQRQIVDTDKTRTGVQKRLCALVAEKDHKQKIVGQLKEKFEEKMMQTIRLEQEQIEMHRQIHEMEQQVSVLNRAAHIDNTAIDETRKIIEEAV